MKFISNFLKKKKDGGSDSPVDAYFLIESKPLFSLAVLKFNKGSRENFHTHAFHSLTWFISGDMEELDISGDSYKYKRNLLPKITKRTKNHKVIANKTSWCITIRGRWVDTWTEYNSSKQKTIILTHGRKEINGVDT